MAGSQIATSVTIISSGLKGFQAVSLTNFTVSAESAIAAGSTVEIGGAFFVFSSDESLTAFSAITTAATAYVELTPSGSAGSQIVNATWTETQPVWNDSKQGWYASAASIVRTVAGAVKTGTSSCESARILMPEQVGTYIKMRSYDIGDWDMSAATGSATVDITHGLDFAKIRAAIFTIRNDENTRRYGTPYLDGEDGDENELGIDYIDATIIRLTRWVSSNFATTVSYNATSYNRGWVIIWYEV